MMMMMMMMMIGWYICCFCKVQFDSSRERDVHVTEHLGVPHEPSGHHTGTRIIESANDRTLFTPPTIVYDRAHFTFSLMPTIAHVSIQYQPYYRERILEMPSKSNVARYGEVECGTIENQK